MGVAVGNALLGSASALAPLTARDGIPDWERIRRLLDEWKPELLLVGLPLNMDDTPSDMSARAERFARRLSGRFGIACEMMDERLSSFEARSRVDDYPSNVALDSIAACLILESWFTAHTTDCGKR
ncbi:MAG: Holliday junction resolvase RuvX [Pseudomonadales bacterium]|nr:Holliday junction resolvase RuvX [Pseudomonadales bacterium]